MQTILKVIIKHQPVEWSLLEWSTWWLGIISASLTPYLYNRTLKAMSQNRIFRLHNKQHKFIPKESKNNIPIFLNSGGLKRTLESGAKLNPTTQENQTYPENNVGPIHYRKRCSIIKSQTSNPQLSLLLSRKRCSLSRERKSNNNIL